MSDSFSDEYKKTMIAVYVNPKTFYFRSYNVGTKEQVDEDYVPKTFTYGRPLLTFIATMRTILQCQEKNINVNIFTSFEAAHWIYDRKSASSMLDGQPKLSELVTKLTAQVFERPLPKIFIWNEKWGEVPIHVDYNNFVIQPEDIFKYVPYVYKKKKARSKKPPPFGDPLEW